MLELVFRFKVYVQESLNARRTVTGTPECSIGHFPDAAASFFLNRLPGQLGTYLGLTGTRLQGELCHSLSLKLILPLASEHGRLHSCRVRTESALRGHA